MAILKRSTTSIDPNSTLVVTKTTVETAEFSVYDLLLKAAGIEQPRENQTIEIGVK